MTSKVVGLSEIIDPEIAEAVNALAVAVMNRTNRQLRSVSIAWPVHQRIQLNTAAGPVDVMMVATPKHRGEQP